MTEALLSVENLHTQFRTEGGLVQAVDDVSFNIQAGETFALVGESGCGKSVTALSIMGLIPNPPGEITSGSIQFGGVDLLKLSSTEMRSIRGSKIGMIFQEPMSSLNPVLTIESQLAEPLKIHTGLSASAANDRAQELIDMVGIPDSKTRLKQYPHELSGGQRQRIMIAMAMACAPRLLIADEATTALDVTIQAQILELLRKLKCELGTALLLINHDLGVVAEIADRVAVMYAGRIVEEAPVRTLFALPRHPYTRALLRSRPRIDTPSQDFTPIPGTAPSLMTSTQGCAFAPRCTSVRPYCSDTVPVLEVLGPSRVACHRVGELN